MDESDDDFDQQFTNQTSPKRQVDLYLKGKNMPTNSFIKSLAPNAPLSIL
jgi:hypothetical protein